MFFLTIISYFVAIPVVVAVLIVHAPRDIQAHPLRHFPSLLRTAAGAIEQGVYNVFAPGTYLKEEITEEDSGNSSGNDTEREDS